MKEGENKPTVPPLNEQTSEVFRQEAQKLLAQTRKIQWIQPSRVEIEEVPLPVPPDDELAEPTEEIRGSAVRGRVLHKMLEEILLEEIQDDETSLRARAAELLQQIGDSDHPDPSEGPSSREIASTVSRTLQLPVVAQYRPTLRPELAVFQCRNAGNENVTAIAGIVDAITQGKEGKPEVVIDWKSDVAPTAETRQHHSAQVREYLEITGALQGLIVYMSTGEVREVLPHGTDGAP